MNGPSPRWTAIATILLLFVLTLIHTPANAQLAASPSAVNFGNVSVGNRSTLAVTVSNTDQSSWSISRASVSTSSYSVNGPTLPVTLAPGQSVTFSTTFAPSAAGAFTDSISISAKSTTTGNKKNFRGNNRQSTGLSVPLAGTGAAAASAGQLSASPASLAFSTIQVGTTSTQFQTVTNAGGTTVNISQAGVSSAAFSVSGLTLPATLAAGQSLTFSVKFAPTTGGTSSGTLTLISDASNSSLGIGLSGSASSPGQLAVNPASIDFGSVIVGQTATKSGSLTASGSSVTISSAGSTTPEFALGGLTLPLTLSPGQSISYSVTFKPQMSGSTAANLSFVSNASTATVSEALTGSGTAAPTHSVDLSWSPSASSAVAGYNVYRGTSASGPFTKVNSGLDGATAYTDTSVAAGSTYYYVATSVDTSGTESGYSNAVSVVIPTP